MDSLTNRLDAYSDLIFYTTPEHFFLQPVENLEEVLTIDRVSNEITLAAFINQIPPSTPSKLVSGILGIVNLISGPHLILIVTKQRIGYINGQEIFKMESFEILPFSKTSFHLTDQQNVLNRQYLSMVQSMLSTSSFYYSTSYDLTHTLQRLHNTSPDFLKMPLFDRADQRFVWNGQLMKDFLVQKELFRYLIPVIHGFISITSVVYNNQPISFILISRRSCWRAGTRLFMRGIDHDGYCANYIETEQIIEVEGHKSSFVLTRGSIPLFWTQLPNLKYKPEMLINPSQNHMQAFQRHFENQIYNYGKQVLVNLINQHGVEAKLELAYEELVRTYNNNNIKYEPFDFHRECGTSRWHRLSILMDRIAQDQEQFKYFMILNGKKKASSIQEGVFRVNCIDCLDRTNVVQSLLANKSLVDQLKRLGILRPTDQLSDIPNFEHMFKNVWANHGDACSVQYAGTGALKSDYTRTGKRTVYGMIKDGINSGIRYYKNNFADGFRQDSIDLILGNYQVDENEHITKPCPLEEKKDWKFLALPMILLVAIAMCFLSLQIPTANMMETVLYIFFWFGMVLVSLVVIFYYGVEFVDYPKLCQKRPKSLYD